MTRLDSSIDVHEATAEATSAAAVTVQVVAEGLVAVAPPAPVAEGTFVAVELAAPVGLDVHEARATGAAAATAASVKDFMLRRGC